MERAPPHSPSASHRSGTAATARSARKSASMGASVWRCGAITPETSRPSARPISSLRSTASSHWP
eukprot:935256-Pyramimonas_sp.AAC.1